MPRSNRLVPPCPSSVCDFTERICPQSPPLPSLYTHHSQHHPDLHITGYRNVEVVLWTHAVGGLTENDLIMAELIDQGVKVAYSPKWLREHPEAAATAKQ